MLLGSNWSKTKTIGFQSREATPGNLVNCIFRIVRKSSTFTVKATAAKLSSLLFYCNQKWNSSKPGFGHQKGECKADNTQQVTQESSLIVCGFSWASDVERSELPSYYEMYISKCEMIPRSALKKMSRKVQREYSGVSVFLPRSPWGLISDHTENGESLPHNGEQLLIPCQNIFKIWTVPSFLWRAAPSMGLVMGGISAHSPQYMRLLSFLCLTC